MPIQFPVCVLWASLSSWIWIQRCIHGAIYYRDVKILVMHKCEQVCQQVEVMTGNRTMNNNAQLYIISLAFMWKPFVWKHEYEATDVQSIVFQIQVPLMQRVYKLQLSTQKHAQWLSLTLSHCGNQLKVPYYMLFSRISQCKNIVKLKWR